MDNNNQPNVEPITIRDEIEFTNNASVRLSNVEVIPRDDYRADPAYNQSLMKKVLEHGLIAGQRLYAEQEVTDDILLGRYYHSVCAGDDLSKTYMCVPKVDKRTKEGKAIWQALVAEAGAKGLTLINEELAEKASLMAIDAYKLMRSLNPKSGAKPQLELSIRARAEISNGADCIVIHIKGQLDYVEVLNTGKVFVGDYKTAPQATETAVRRKMRESNWPLQAYVYTLLASAWCGKPAECAYVVSSKEHMTHRAYDFSQPTLDDGRKSFMKAAYRIIRQGVSDEEYLRRTTL